MATAKTGCSCQGQAAKEEGQEERRDGIAHIQSTFNNTVVTITDVNGNAICVVERPARAASRAPASPTPFAAQLAAEEAARKAMEHGMRSIAVFVKGPGAGRESALRALQSAGFRVDPDSRRDAGSA